MNAIAEFTSSSMLCALVQRSPREIAKAANALGIVPALALNNVQHYSSDQVDQIVKHFRENQSTQAMQATHPPTLQR